MLYQACTMAKHINKPKHKICVFARNQLYLSSLPTYFYRGVLRQCPASIILTLKKKEIKLKLRN